MKVRLTNQDTNTFHVTNIQLLEILHLIQISKFKDHLILCTAKDLFNCQLFPQCELIAKDSLRYGYMKVINNVHFIFYLFTYPLPIENFDLCYFKNNLLKYWQIYFFILFLQCYIFVKQDFERSVIFY